MTTRAWLLSLCAALGACDSGAALSVTADGGAGATDAGEVVTLTCGSTVPTATVAAETPPPLEVVVAGPSSRTFGADDQRFYEIATTSEGMGQPGTFEVFAIRPGEAPLSLHRATLARERAVTGRIWSSGDDIAWIDYEPSKPPNFSGAVRVLAKAGGQPVTLAEGLDTAPLPYGEGLRLLGGEPSRLYVMAPGMPGIGEAAKPGGPLRRLVALEREPLGFAADDTHLYWTTTAGLWRARKDGAGAALLARGLNAPGVLAVDGQAVYVVALVGAGSLDLAIARVPKTGGGPCAILPAPWGASPSLRLMADASGLYVVATAASDLGGDALWWLALDGQRARVLVAWEALKPVQLLHLAPGHVHLALVRERWMLARVPKP